MLTKIITVTTIMLLSRLHGSEVFPYKIVKSILFGLVAYLGFIYSHNINIAWYGLAIIAIVAGAKSSHYTHGLIMLRNSEPITWRGVGEFFWKGLAMTVPFVILAIWQLDLQSAMIVSLGSFQLLIGYGVGYWVQKKLRPLSDNLKWFFMTQATVVGELLGALWFGLTLVM